MKKTAVLSREPILQADLPSLFKYPWEKWHQIYFNIKILVVDYFLKFVEFSEAFFYQFSEHWCSFKIHICSSWSAHYAGYRQWTSIFSYEMTQFSSIHRFNHITSSPHYHQFNGLAERTVKTVKQMFTTSPDVNLA